MNICHQEQTDFQGLIQTKCYLCGKTFCHFPEYVYKRKHNNLIVYFCSYTCLRKYDLETALNKTSNYATSRRRKEAWYLSVEGCKYRLKDCKQKYRGFARQLDAYNDGVVKDHIQYARLSALTNRWKANMEQAEAKLIEMKERENKHE